MARSVTPGGSIQPKALMSEAYAGENWAPNVGADGITTTSFVWLPDGYALIAH